MAKSQFKMDLDRRTKLAADIRDAHEIVRKRYEEATEVIQGEIGEVNARVLAFNELVDKARSFVQDEVGDMQETFDERSESWQDSEKGQAVSNFLADLESFNVDDLEEWGPDLEWSDYNEDDCSQADDLENLPDEPE